jgi:hypothetical protein
MDRDRETRIRERAYEIWLREGRPHGRDGEHWQRAAAEIAAASAAAGNDPPREPETVDGGGAMPLRSQRAPRRPKKPAGS